MVEFRKLSKVKLEKILQELVTFFYKKAKINISVENAMELKEYKTFHKDVAKALDKQIKPYMKEKRIKDIISTLKKVDRRDVALTIATSFIIFKLAFDGEEDAIKDFLKWATVIGGTDALTRLGISDTSFTGDSDEVIKIIDDRLDFFTKQIDQTTMEWLAMNIELGINQDLSASEIAQMIGEGKDDLITRRSAIIAETELVSIVGETVLLVFKNNGVKQVRWITVGDERTCQICMGNEGDGWIKISESFSSGVETTPAHILCRCYLEPKTTNKDKVWRG